MSKHVSVDGHLSTHAFSLLSIKRERAAERCVDARAGVAYLRIAIAGARENLAALANGGGKEMRFRGTFLFVVAGATGTPLSDRDLPSRQPLRDADRRSAWVGRGSG
jgi:hypothetical protein